MIAEISDTSVDAESSGQPTDHFESHGQTKGEDWEGLW
jgi:hypothetical protein